MPPDAPILIALIPVSDVVAVSEPPFQLGMAAALVTVAIVHRFRVWRAR